jgi:hypothetical protein
MRRFILLLTLIAFFLPLSIAAAPTTVCDSTISTDGNTLACYKLEDTADDVASLTLTNNNSVSFATAAKFGNGADGGAGNTNKSLTNTTDILTSGSMPISFACWVKPHSTPSGGASYTLMAVAGNGGNVHYLVQYFEDAGTVYLRASRTKRGVGTDNADYATTLSLADFSHFLLSYDGSNNLRLYLNGTNVATSTGVSGDGVNNSGSGISQLAWKTTGGTPLDIQYASVILDDCIITNDVLTPTEVNQIYNGFPAAASTGLFPLGWDF